MTVWQTILVFVVIPAAAYGLIALLAGGGSRGKRATRYRPGQEWTYDPVWWTGNPAGMGAAGAGQHGGHDGAEGHGGDRVGSAGAAATEATATGGASGNW